MTAILTTNNNVSNFLIREQWRDRNFCRSDEAVILAGIAGSSTGITAGETRFKGVVEVGAIVMRLKDADEKTPFEALDENFTTDSTLYDIGIIVDERVGDPTFYSPEDGQITPDWTLESPDTVTLALLVRGDAMVRLGGLSLEGDTYTDLVKASLEAQGITIIDKLSGKYSVSNKRGFRPYK
jgi:hypothetical protein